MPFGGHSNPHCTQYREGVLGMGFLMTLAMVMTRYSITANIRWYETMCSCYMEQKEAASALCLTTASVINPALSQRPRKNIHIVRKLKPEKLGELVPFQSTEGSLLTATLRLFFSGWLWAAPGVTGSRSNGGRLTDAYFQPWMLHIKKIDGMGSGWAGDKLLGCESPQWVYRLCSIDLSRGSHNPSKLLIASHHDYWLKYEGGILDSWREAVYYTHWGWWSSYRWRNPMTLSNRWFDFRTQSILIA